MPVISGIQRSFLRMLFASIVLSLSQVSVLWCGVNAWTSGGPSGGWVQALAVDPTDSNTLYAGTGLSGIFKSSNGGASWTVINNNLVYFGAIGNILDIAIDPTNPKIVFAASDRGIYRTSDAGGSWRYVTDSLGMFVPRVYALAIDPTSTNIIYGVGYSDGFSTRVFKSIDGGNNWSTLSSSFPGFLTSVAVAIDSSTTPGTVYVASADKIYKSSDGGVNWISASNGLQNQSIAAIRIDPQNQGTIYAATNRYSGSGGVYKSIDGAATWTLISMGLPDYAAYRFLITPNGIYLGTNQGIYRSTDRGISWSPVNNGLLDTYVYALAWSSTGILFAGTRGSGVFYSYDNGATWGPLNVGLNATSVNALAVSSSGVLLSGTGQSGIFRSSDGSGSWTSLPGAPRESIHSIAFDPVNPNTIYLGTFDNSGFYISTDAGVTWIRSNGGLNNNGVLCIAVVPQIPGTIFVGTAAGVYKSIDHGAHWSAVNSGLPTSGFSAIYFLAVDPTNPNFLFAAGDNGIYKSVDGGGTWNNYKNGLLGYGSTNVRSIAVDPTSSNTVYLGTLGGIFKSTDGGVNWSVAGSLISLSHRYPVGVASVLIDPANPLTLYAGTSDGGVFKSTDGGTLWNLIGAGLGFVSVNGLALDPLNQNTIYAATNGGVYSFSNGLNGGPTSVNIALSAGGVGSSFTSGVLTSTYAGYATGTVNLGPAPYGTAVFSYIQNGLLVSEAGVPVSPPTQSALIFIDYRRNVIAKTQHQNLGIINVNTGLAAVNAGSNVAHISLTLRDARGTILAQGNLLLAQSAHLAKFIDQLGPDFILPADFSSSTGFGTLEVKSDQPLSVLALRLTTNQRGDTLLTTVPVADLTVGTSNDHLSFPQLVDGGGYQTALVLMNTSASTETGVIQIFDDNGISLAVELSDGSGSSSSVRYTIPPKGLFQLSSVGLSTVIKAGSVQVVPDVGSKTPTGAGVLSLSQNGILVSESGIPAAALTNHARIYIDRGISSVSGFLNRETGLALADTSGSDHLVSFTAYLPDGSTLVGSGSVLVKGNGHFAKFAQQVVASIGTPFTGILDISSSIPFAALTLRLSFNTRGDFLLTTFPVADATRPAPMPLIFPQIVDSGGYKTQFILLNASGAISNTTLSFYDDQGRPLAVGK